MDEAIFSEPEGEDVPDNQDLGCEPYVYPQDTGNGKWLLNYFGTEVALPCPHADGFGEWMVECDTEGEWVVSDGVRTNKVKSLKTARTVWAHSFAASCNILYYIILCHNLLLYS